MSVLSAVPAGGATTTRRNAVTLLVTAGDNPNRLSSEASFAALCGVSPGAHESQR